MLYALKKLIKSSIVEYGMVEQLILELKIHSRVRHPNIIQFYTYFSDEYHVFILMEYAEGGELVCARQEEPLVRRVIGEVVSAVEYLQMRRIAHRDLKPENIVTCCQTVKLCDFGCAALFDEHMRRTICGTLDYLSPEMKDRGEYNVDVDVWSVGVLTFELLAGFAPFKDDIALWKQNGAKFQEGWSWRVVFPEHISASAQQFIACLLKENPEERASIHSCKSHPFLRAPSPEGRWREFARVLD